MKESDIEKYDSKFMPGLHNRLIRYYFYLNRGLDILNQFRNLGLGIFALYFAMHLTNIFWLIGMAIPSVIVLTVVGYYVVHHMTKVSEWLNMRFSTHYSIKSFDYQERQTLETEKQTKLLQEILTKLK